MRLPVDSSASPLVQNIGPGTVYFDTRRDVTVGTGFRLAAGAAYEFPRDLNQSGGALFLVADADSDVRYVEVG